MSSQLNVRPLSAELQAKAELELFEKPDRIQADLETLRAWLAKTPHLKSRTDDQFLLTFLRGCKFSMERTKEKLETYYTIRNAIPEMFANRRVTQEIIDLIRIGVLVPLPQTDGPAGPRICIFQVGQLDHIANVYQLFKVINMMQDIMLLEDNNVIVAGTTTIIDVKGATTATLRQTTPMFIKKVIMSAHDAAPLRIKGQHFVNTPTFFLTFFNIVKSFMSDKIKSRVNIARNVPI